MIQDDTVMRATQNSRWKRGWLIASAILLAIGGAAIAAVSVGKFYCPDCTFDYDTISPETSVFISSEVNRYTNGTWLDSKGDPKEVTICNGSECATYTYLHNGRFLLLKKDPSNWQADNGGGGGDGGGGGGGDGGGGGVMDPGPGNWGGSGPPVCNGPCSGSVTVGG